MIRGSMIDDEQMSAAAVEALKRVRDHLIAEVRAIVPEQDHESTLGSRLIVSMAMMLAGDLVAIGCLTVGGPAEQRARLVFEETLKDCRRALASDAVIVKH